MSPSRRFPWQQAFQELRAIVDFEADAPTSRNSRVLCAECNQPIQLLLGKRSHKWYWSHIGLIGCEDVRAVFFATKQEAMAAEMVFK